MSTMRRHSGYGRRHGAASATTRTMAAMLIGLIACGARPAHAQDSTQPLLGAVKVVDTLWVRQTTDGLDFAVNDNAREFLTLKPGVTFVAPGEIKLAWKGFNPLAVAVSASETSVPDPNFAAVTQFLDTLAKLPDLVSKAQSGDISACTEVQSAADLLDRLNNALNQGSIVTEELKKWRDTLTNQPGAASVATVQGQMGTTAKNIRDAVKIARARWADLGDLADKMVANVKLAEKEAIATKALAEKALAEKALAERLAAEAAAAAKKGAKPAAANPAPASPSAAAGGNPGSGTGVPVSPGTATGTPPAMGQGTGTGQTSGTTITAAAAACQDAAVVVGLIAQALRVTDVVNRIDLLERLAGDVEKMQAGLDPVAKGVWVADSFVFHRVTATAKDIKTITVKSVPLSSRLVSGVLVRTNDTDKAVSAAFNLRQHSAIVTEVVPGFIVAKVSAPQYETGLDANGKTVIVRGKDKDVSYGGALLLNGILGAHRKSVLYPMVQVGASISPDGPGILAGFGGRFNGSRALAFSAGGILAWVKDLQTLQPGAPVGSKNDIKADLGYEPTVKWYFALQYNFK
jgi:hypothetical protein